ncbi:MAG TPA: hypothetical protein VJU84_08535 [Pyrinomonadaceae bacterium]|nr:hypothetical protein [Pyrinomonadaceae bacterium]
MSLIPQPRLPHVTLPAIRNIPTIPFVGCAGAQGTTYVGEQFGNVPDIGAIREIKSLKKALEEQIYALIQGQLPDPTRPAPYAARAVQLADEVTQLVTKLNEVIAGATAEATAAIGFVNDKVGELNAAKGLLEGIPAGARSPVQQLMMERYDQSVGELNAQAARLQSTIECLAA